jgi:hypothetical protein
MLFYCRILKNIGILMNSNKLIVDKHSSTVAISSKLTLTQRKHYNYLLDNAQKQLKEEPNQTIFTIPQKELLNFFGLDKNYQYLERELKPLMEIVIEYNLFNKDKKRKYTAFPLLAGIDIEYGIVSYAFSPFMMDLVFNPDIFATINITVTKGIKSNYTLVLYELLEDYKTAPKIPKMTIEKFRTIMGIGDDKYKVFQKLKRDVIDRAVNEINSNEDIAFIVDYDLIKSGRKYSHIDFKFKFKEGRIPERLLNHSKKQEELENKKRREIAKFVSNVKKEYLGKKFCKPYYVGLSRYLKDTTFSIDTKTKMVKNDVDGKIVDVEIVQELFEKLYEKRNQAILGKVDITIFDYIGRKISLIEKVKDINDIEFEIENIYKIKNFKQDGGLGYKTILQDIKTKDIVKTQTLQDDVLLDYIRKKLV